MLPVGKHHRKKQRDKVRHTPPTFHDCYTQRKRGCCVHQKASYGKYQSRKDEREQTAVKVAFHGA